METICLQSASFVTASDVSWSREVVRDASISCVSVSQELNPSAWLPEAPLMYCLLYITNCHTVQVEELKTFEKLGNGIVVMEIGN